MSASPDWYKDISYASNPFPQSEPGRLFGLARLFGLDAPRPETMRVLELGSSSGGNIIPLAARFPEAHFVGVDLAPRHVAEARERIVAAGLRNIEIVVGDIATFDPGPDARFDAVICHGVYSWVPPAARDGILRLAGRHLAADGVAYVSYNVFPGWHLRAIIRDLMLYHAGAEGQAPASERIAKARWVIENVSKISNAGSPYGAKLREEAAALSGWGDSYILGEFLVPFNDPCYFRDFVAAAETHDLAFLCEAEIETCLPETHGAEVAKLIRTMSANKLVPMEQYIDFFMGRQFRQTLLVKTDAAQRVKRQLLPEAVRGLEISGQLSEDVTQRAGDRRLFKTPNGRTVTTTSAAVVAAVERVGGAYPQSCSVDALVAGAGNAKAQTEVLDVAFQMIVGGLVKPSTHAVRAGSASAERPVAFALTRADAKAGRTASANLRHETVALDAVAQVLVPLLDGTHDRTLLRQRLVEAVLGGRINITDTATGVPIRGAALETAAAEHVELALKRMAGAAVLLPQP